MMTIKIGMMRKIGFGTLVGALTLGGAYANAEQFEASVSVQNTLALNVVQGMEFGTLFASGANDQAIAGLTLTPAGEISAATPMAVAGADATGAPQFFSLGGQAAARGSVASSRDFVITVPNLPSTALVVSEAFVPGAGIPLKLNDDPTEPAFYLVDFTVGDPVGGTVTEDTDGKWDVDPAFGVTEVEFGIGATIFTDGAGGDRTDYREATYTGTFNVTASY